MNILINELNYKPEIARATCHDLMAIQDPEIRQALLEWVQTRKRSSVIAEDYDAALLSQKMHYPSALLAIDMLRSEPLRAKQLLRGFR